MECWIINWSNWSFRRTTITCTLSNIFNTIKFEKKIIICWTTCKIFLAASFSSLCCFRLLLAYLRFTCAFRYFLFISICSILQLVFVCVIRKIFFQILFLLFTSLIFLCTFIFRHVYYNWQLKYIGISLYLITFVVIIYFNLYCLPVN